jgi:YHS domain-containing protein
MMKKNFFAFAMIALAVALGFSPTIDAYLDQESSQPREAEAEIPLEGLDPVLLTQGKEVLGKMNIYAIRGQYKYLFSSEENKSIFEKNSSQYEIQLGGSCARMGPQVGGHPDIFAVHQGRIYLFGSSHCQELFIASPEKYLEPALPEMKASPEAIDKGRALIEKAVAAMGGAAKTDALTSYQETSSGTVMTRQGETPFKYSVIKVFRDRVRYEQTRSFGKLVDVIAPGSSFTSFQDDTQNSVRPMPAIKGAALEKLLKHNSLEVLLARKRPGFTVAATGASKVGETTVEQVAVMFEGVFMRLGIDAASGRILSLTFIGRHADTGEVGEIVQTFSDFRTVAGLTLPFKASGTFKGVDDPRQSYKVESIAINEKIDPAIFQKP